VGAILHHEGHNFFVLELGVFIVLVIFIIKLAHGWLCHQPVLAFAEQQ
jgi:hypothetical protein